MHSLARAFGAQQWNKYQNLLCWLIYTVNSVIFTRILFSQIALKDIFAAVKICDYLLGHDLPISVTYRVISSFREDIIFTKPRLCEVL